MQDDLESVDTILRQNQRCYSMQKLWCIECGRTLPTGAKKCHPCRNTALEQRYCTLESRVAEYFETLRRCELWPSRSPLCNCSISDIAFRFACVKRDLKHHCVMASRCPLHVAVHELSVKVDQHVKGVRGLCLSCVKDEAWDGDELCTHGR
jgi:ribosomal protein L40E